MTGLGYNPHTFSIIHNQPKAPLEDEGREELFMKHLFTMLLALVAATASAQDFEIDGIYYNILSEDDRTVEVTESPYGYSGEVVIPAEVTYDGSTYSITAIGEQAFGWCDDLTSVSMPEVTTIGDVAFGYCSALTSVEMPEATMVGDHAFYYCSALTSVEMPEVTTIGREAFSFCSALTSAEMPAVTTIGHYAFSDCSALTLVSMPEVLTIGDGAFNLCSALTSVEMPAVTTIGEYAFGWCSDLAYIHLPASCTSVFSNPFVYCIELKEIVVDENNPNYLSANGALYDKGKTTLIGWPTAEGDITIPQSVTTIGESAFESCSALTSVSMPEATTIGDGAFGNCDGLTSVSMPSATTIGYGAFYYCSALTSIDIPASVTMIGEGAFTYCDALTSVYCHWHEPLECEPEFEDEIFMNATLYVPDGCIDAYRSVYPWSEFANIEEGGYSGIADTTQPEVTVKVIDGVITVEGGDGMASAPVVEVYSAGGQRVYRGTDSSIGGLPRGVYVVKVDGTVQKVAL